MNVTPYRPLTRLRIGASISLLLHDSDFSQSLKHLDNFLPVFVFGGVM
jgi:hypothetical protein